MSQNRIYNPPLDDPVVREIHRVAEENPPTSVRIGKYVIGVVIVATLLYVGLSALSNMMEAPERKARVHECAIQMDSELLGHARDVDPCKGLSGDEKRDAAYEWARETGRL